MQRSSYHIIKKRITRLSREKGFEFFQLLIKNIWYVVPTFLASMEALTISQKLFGNKHFGHGQENAYRHALWTYLIAEKTGNIKWAEEFTNQYECIFLNQPMDTQMDLHNNKVGLTLYKKYGKMKKAILELKMSRLYESAQPIISTKMKTSKIPSDVLIYY